MQVAFTVFTQLTVLLMLTLAGWTLRRTNVIEHTGHLSGVLSKAALPAMIVHSLQTPLSLDTLGSIGTIALWAIVINVVCIAVGVLFCAVFKTPRFEAGVWICCVGYTNSVFMGKPLMHALFGDAMLPLLTGLIIGSNLMTFSVGASIMSRESSRYGIVTGLLRTFRTPSVLACFTGLILFFMPFRLSGPVSDALGLLASLTTPLSMMILGGELAQTSIKGLFLGLDAYKICFARLVVCPLILWPALALFVKDPVMLGVLLITTAMPTAAVITVICKEEGGNAQLCSNATLLSTLLCVVTVPLFIWLAMR